MNEQEARWLISALRKVNFFEHLDLYQMDSLSRQIEKYSYPKGYNLITEGDEGKAFFILYKGKVKVEKKKGILFKSKVAELGPGSFFGEMSLFTDEPCSATIVALEPVEVFVLFKNAFKEHLTRNPELLVEIKHIIDKRNFELKQKK